MAAGEVGGNNESEWKSEVAVALKLKYLTRTLLEP
jgi:hypothetical protein